MILVSRPEYGPLDEQEVEQRPKFNFFLEYSQVAYQIKGNDACNNMVANILTIDPSLDPGRVKSSEFNFFKIWSCCMLNQRGLQMPQHGIIYSVLTRTIQTLGGTKGQNIFSESSHVAYQKRTN